MNSFIAVFFLAAVAMASAGHVGLGWAGGWGGHGGWGGGHGGWGGHGWNPAAHIASGSVAVGPNGATIAGPAGSVSTDNGLHGHGAGARLSGPAGEVGTHGGAASLAGPGIGHGGWGHGGVGWAGHGGWGHGGWGHGW